LRRPDGSKGAESVCRRGLSRSRRALRREPPPVALVAREGTPLAELDLGEQATFVLGAEREGLPAEVVAGCDATAHIPLAPNAESLNVAMAGAIALYEWRRRRG
jgi:tRNA G18 (ribose-2'-O)-methylase SpoU